MIRGGGGRARHRTRPRPGAGSKAAARKKGDRRNGRPSWEGGGETGLERHLFGSEIVDLRRGAAGRHVPRRSPGRARPGRRSRSCAVRLVVGTGAGGRARPGSRSRSGHESSPSFFHRRVWSLPSALDQPALLRVALQHVDQPVLERHDPVPLGLVDPLAGAAAVDVATRRSRC